MGGRALMSEESRNPVTLLLDIHVFFRAVRDAGYSPFGK